MEGNEGLLIRIALDKPSILHGSYANDSAGFVTLPMVGCLHVVSMNSVQAEEIHAKRMSQNLLDEYSQGTTVGNGGIRSGDRVETGLTCAESPAF